MRTKTDLRFVTDTDPTQVMNALLAVEQLPEWSSIYRDARVASHDGNGRPERVFVKTELLGRSDLQVLEYSWRHNRVAWTVTDSTIGAKGNGWFVVAGDLDGSDVRFHEELYLPIPVPGFLLKRSVQRANELVVENFIEFAEQFPVLQPQFVPHDPLAASPPVNRTDRPDPRIGEIIEEGRGLLLDLASDVDDQAAGPAHNHAQRANPPGGFHEWSRNHPGRH